MSGEVTKDTDCLVEWKRGCEDEVIIAENRAGKNCASKGMI